MSRTSINLPIRRDVPLQDQCGHGKLWKEPCAECEIVWLTNSLERDEPRVARDRAKLNQLLAARSSDMTGARNGG